MVFKCIGTYRHKGQVAIKLEAVDIERPRRFQTINKKLLKRDELRMLRMGIPVYLSFIREEDLLEKANG